MRKSSSNNVIAALLTAKEHHHYDNFFFAVSQKCPLLFQGCVNEIGACWYGQCKLPTLQCLPVSWPPPTLSSSSSCSSSDRHTHLLSLSFSLDDVKRVFFLQIEMLGLVKTRFFHGGNSMSSYTAQFNKYCTVSKETK